MWKRQDARGDFVHRIFANLVSAARAKRAPGARVQQTQVIVDFRCRSDSRTRIACRVLLLDRDGRGDPRDFIHVRLLDTLEKLARVGRKRFDIPTLAFRINCVKGQARFSRTGNSRDERDGVVRNIEADIFQVVDARPADPK